MILHDRFYATNYTPSLAPYQMYILISCGYQNLKSLPAILS